MKLWSSVSIVFMKAFTVAFFLSFFASGEETLYQYPPFSLLALLPTHTAVPRSPPLLSM